MRAMSSGGNSSFEEARMMFVRGRKALVLLVAMLMVGLGNLPVVGLEPVDRGGSERGPGPLDSADVWTDPLDDTSHVYIPPTGLVNVEVSGGDAHLKAGENIGWIASETITCPAGMRYDLIFLEVDAPGASYVELSVLNASASPSEIGFANETISGFRLVKATDLSITSIGAKMFPDIRIQVTLHASGTDRPRLLAWSVYFIGPEEWRDEFLGRAKMESDRGINITNGVVELNLSRRAGTGTTSTYEAFPPVFFGGWGPSDNTPVFYPNAERDGYDNVAQFSHRSLIYPMFADLNNDGDLDMVCANGWHSGGPIPSEILWGDGTDRWSDVGATELNVNSAGRAAFGDVNGDGEVDIVIAGRTSTGSYVFLNKGGGSFSYEADIVFDAKNYLYVDTGDLNNDDIDDIVFNINNQCDIYYGAIGGPDKTVDVTLTGGGSSNYGVLVADINGDGFNDVSFGGEVISTLPIYLGSKNGLDATPDINLNVGSYSTKPEIGDINGDGYLDLVVGAGPSPYGLWFFKGSASGLTSSNVHKITFSAGWANHVRVMDVDKDGFDDVLLAVGGNTFNIYKGGETWPTSPYISKTGSTGAQFEVAVSTTDLTSGLGGSFVTEPITLPQGKKWDMVNIEASLPKNTSIRVSILDDKKKPIDDHKDLLARNVDLSDILPTFHRTIRVKVHITSEFNNTTPALDSILVKWQDEGTWRDEFYGPAKVARMFNLDVADGTLGGVDIGGTGPQIILPSVLGDDGYTTHSLAYMDAGGLDYTSKPPMDIATKGTSAVDVTDVNDDGFLDLTFAVHRTADAKFTSKSPMFLGTPVGIRQQPDHEFPTTGATDVLVRDLDEDGHMDVVFSQEQDTGDFIINSTLFWGSADGWSSTPDMEFMTTGASGVEAADLDGDGDLDLVFACNRDDSSRLVDSMVFLQDASGFDGTSPSHRLATEGATAVATGDLNKDTRIDIVFANSFSGGFAEIDSFIYWGKLGGGFEETTRDLPTSGVRDVQVADLDRDGDLDIVFANQIGNTGKYDVDSYVYLNDGSGGFGDSPDVSLPTMGASAVTAVDLDGTGWLDLVFACEREETTYQVPSLIYLGGTGGWGSIPDIRLDTEGATDVAVAQLMKYGSGGYLSRGITPEDPPNTGTFHTFRYSASLGTSQSGMLQLVDRDTWEVLAETSMASGTHEWIVADLFDLKDHPSIRVAAIVTGLETGSTFELDDLWLNWTERIKRPPLLHGLELDSPSIYRNEETVLWVNVSDEYDRVQDLQVTVRHRLNGTQDLWDTYLLGNLEFDDASESWMVKLRPLVSAPLGVYDFQATVTDNDFMHSPWVEFPELLEVMNNLPSAPEVRIMPAKALTTSTLKVEIVTPSQDVETTGLSYRYTWYRDGVALENVTTETLSAYYTSKGQNWSVEVSAFDGDDQGPPGFGWRIIENAPPIAKEDLPDPQFDEDTTDMDWLDLSTAFEDPDGDHLTWSLETPAENLGVTIDPATGQVTLTPASNWFGEEILTFVASDGEFNATQTVTVLVTSVNDIPSIATVDGQPVTGDTITYTIKQGELLEIRFAVADVEGDEVVATVNSSAVTLDEVARLISFQADNDAVGTLRFGLRIYDVESPTEKVSLNFVIVIENENDEMDDPWIKDPTVGESFWVNQSFSLVGMCDDPDIQWGQVLNYTWESNISGILGYGSSLTVRILEPGIHRITLTVRDPDFAKTVTVDVEIKPREDEGPPITPNGDDEPSNINWALWAGLIAVLVIVGAVFYVLTTKRRTEAEEAADEEEYKREHMERAHEAVKAAAEYLETEREETEAAKDYEEIEIETDAIPSTGLSMEASKTEAASEETQKLFAGISDLEPEESEEEREALRIDNLKRAYQNAIGRLPYGIPSKELADRDWVDLANALATGEKKTLPDGQETTEIDGRWYYSDAKDTGTFLKEHGAKPKKEEPKKTGAAPAADKSALLAKLEERFIMGEISEAAYEELKQKYGE
jgi:hypothetical protein